MLAETFIKGNKTTIPEEIFKKLGKRGNIAKWDINKEGKIEIEIEEIPEECLEFAEELDKIRADMKDGDYVEIDPEDLAKKLGVDPFE